MRDWMMQHPWMTFFIAMTLVGGVADWLRRRTNTQARWARFEASKAATEAAHLRARTAMARPRERQAIEMPIANDGAPVVGRAERAANGKFGGGS